MNAIEKFWIEIGALITTKFGNGHPKDWDKFKIDVFLRGFQKNWSPYARKIHKKQPYAGHPGQQMEKCKALVCLIILSGEFLSQKRVWETAPPERCLPSTLVLIQWMIF